MTCCSQDHPENATQIWIHAPKLNPICSSTSESLNPLFFAKEAQLQSQMGDWATPTRLGFKPVAVKMQSILRHGRRLGCVMFREVCQEVLEGYQANRNSLRGGGWSCNLLAASHQRFSVINAPQRLTCVPILEKDSDDLMCVPNHCLVDFGRAGQPDVVGVLKSILQLRPRMRGLMLLLSHLIRRLNLTSCSESASCLCMKSN